MKTDNREITIKRLDDGKYRRWDAVSYGSSVDDTLDDALLNGGRYLDPTIESIEVKRKAVEIRAGMVLESPEARRVLLCSDRDGFDLLILGDDNLRTACEFHLDELNCIYHSRSEVMRLIQKSGWRILPGRVEYVEDATSEEGKPEPERADDNPMPELRPGYYVECGGVHRGIVTRYESPRVSYRALVGDRADWFHVTNTTLIKDRSGQLLWKSEAA